MNLRRGGLLATISFGALIAWAVSSSACAEDEALPPPSAPAAAESFGPPPPLPPQQPVASATPVAPAAPPASAAPPAPAEHVVPGASHVSFPSNDAVLTSSAPTTIDALLFRPWGDGPFPAVILLHTCQGIYRKDGALFPRSREYADRLVRDGYVVLMPDSFSSRGLEGNCLKPEKARPLFERVRDLQGAHAWLEAQPFVRSDRVGVLGWTQGAVTMLGAIAAQDPTRPKTAHEFKVAIGFYPACEPLLGQTLWPPPVAPVHLLLGEKDPRSPPSVCQDLMKTVHAPATAPDVKIYPNADHDFDSPRHRAQAPPTGDAGGHDWNAEARADSITRVTRILHDALLN